MRRLFVSLGIIAFFFVVIFFPPFLRAQTEQSAFPVQVTKEPNLLGQDHYYTVTFRGNGEAIVSTRVAFTNLTEESQSMVALRVPKVQPQDISVYQVIREPQCIRYGQVQSSTSPGATGVSSGVSYTKMRPSCEEYQPADYYQYWYGQNKYQKASYELKGDSIEVTLPQSISPNGSGSFLVYYRAFGYAKKNIFGAYEFSFETLKTEDKIQTLQVGITTDSDLYLKGTKGKVNYRLDSSSLEMKAGATSAVSSPRIDSFYQQIGQGVIVKNASNLQPLDSYTVKGVYAESVLSLYAKEIIWGIVILVGIILLFSFFLKRTMRSFHQTQPQEKRDIFPVSHPILGLFSFSFLVSVCIVVYTIVIYLFFTHLYYLSYDSSVSPAIVILALIISIAVYGGLFLLPAIVIGLKRGLWWGVGFFFSVTGWLVFALMIVIVAAFILRFQNDYYPYPVEPPMMKSSNYAE